MTYILSGFLFGCLIPYLARRIGKLMPASFGYILLKMWWPAHYMPWVKLKTNPKYTDLLQRYIMRAVGWGIFTAAASYLFANAFVPSSSGYAVWHVAFLWILLLLVETDKRFMLLPDVLTLPLLIMGFAYASFGGPWIMRDIWPILSPAEFSALGAAFGFLMPVLASLFVVWKYPEAFGAGDVKLLTALGAWMGISGISYVILGACVIFALTCLINRMRIGPFGPAIVYAALIFLLLSFGL